MPGTPHQRFPFTSSGIQTLRCPRCSGDYLHQGTVTVYDRGEDAKVTAVSTVQNGLVSNHIRPTEETWNPSSRRHGVVIAFWCELCHGQAVPEGVEREDLWLTFAQHKGVTHVGWVFEKEDGHGELETSVLLPFED